MFETEKIYIRSLVAITGLTLVMLYAIHTNYTDSNTILAGIAAVVACVLLDTPKPGV